jgi:hypothetical protein
MLRAIIIVQIANRIHKPLKIIAFNANGIQRQRYELSKQLQDWNIDVALFSETYKTTIHGPIFRIATFMELIATRKQKVELPLQTKKPFHTTM